MISTDLPESDKGIGTPGIRKAVDDDATVSPSESELRQLYHVPGRIPWAALVIGIIEMFERFSFKGTVVVCICRLK
jgi:hypothetical protein